MDGSNSGVLFCNNGRYSETPFGHPEEIDRTIDCGENEDLFLALAALRDDTDIHQWFIYDTMDCTDEKRRMREFLQCTDDSIEDMMFYDCAFLDCHKATVEEIIEKFKVEKEEVTHWMPIQELPVQ